MPKQWKTLPIFCPSGWAAMRLDMFHKRKEPAPDTLLKDVEKTASQTHSLILVRKMHTNLVGIIRTKVTVLGFDLNFPDRGVSKKKSTGFKTKSMSLILQGKLTMGYNESFVYIWHPVGPDPFWSFLQYVCPRPFKTKPHFSPLDPLAEPTVLTKSATSLMKRNRAVLFGESCTSFCLMWLKWSNTCLPKDLCLRTCLYLGAGSLQNARSNTHVYRLQHCKNVITKWSSLTRIHMKSCKLHAFNCRPNMFQNSIAGHAGSTVKFHPANCIRSKQRALWKRIGVQLKDLHHHALAIFRHCSMVASEAVCSEIQVWQTFFLFFFGLDFFLLHFSLSFALQFCWNLFGLFGLRWFLLRLIFRFWQVVRMIGAPLHGWASMPTIHISDLGKHITTCVWQCDFHAPRPLGRLLALDAPNASTRFSEGITSTDKYSDRLCIAHKMSNPDQTLSKQNKPIQTLDIPQSLHHQGSFLAIQHADQTF